MFIGKSFIIRNISDMKYSSFTVYTKYLNKAHTRSYMVVVGVSKCSTYSKELTEKRGQSEL